MVDEATAEALAKIAQGRWPADYDGDDQLIFDDDLPPHAAPLAAE